MLWMLLIGCSGTEGTLVKVPPDPTPSTYTPPERDPLPDPLTLPQIEAAIPDLLRQILGADPRLIFSAHDSMRMMEDSSCPYYDSYHYDYYGTYYWDSDCTTTGGTWISGFAEHLHLKDFQYGDGFVDDYGYFVGDALFVRPDSQEYWMAGEALLNDVDYEGYHFWRSYIAGTFLWEGQDEADTWLTDGRTWFLFLDAYYADYGARKIALSGGMGGLSGLVETINLDDLFWYDQEWGATCELEPGGVIALRDTAGRWYEVQFHGHTFEGAGVFPPLCDGCGDVYLNGELMGQVCPDLSPMMEWGEEGPWQ